MDEKPEPLDMEAHRQNWLNGLLDEFEKVEKLKPAEWLPKESDYPPWVENIINELVINYFPVAKLRSGYELTPKRVGSVIGHTCALAVLMRETIWDPLEMLPEIIEDIPVAIENSKSPDDIEKKVVVFLSDWWTWYAAMRRLAKRSLCSCVDQTYEDMTDFLLAYSDAFSRKPKSFDSSSMGNPTLEIYQLMLVSWKHIQTLKSVRQLHEYLVSIYGPYRTGDRKRIEKICQRISLSFGKRGRPRKKLNPTSRK